MNLLLPSPDYPVMSDCYLCGATKANHPLKLKNTFTAHSLARCPQSTKLCNRCEWAINLRAYYFNPTKKKYSLIYSRNWSWLYSGETLIAPTFNGEKDGIPIVENLPTRELIRQWLILPPEPPFTIAIAESGQKHILFLAQQAETRDVFPVQFELDTLIFNKLKFVSLLASFERIMGLGATKTEILTGNYKSQFLQNNLHDYWQDDNVIAPHRGSRLLELVNYCAQKQG
jgi:hypothetical protein